MISEIDQTRIVSFYSCRLTQSEAEQLLEDIKTRPELMEMFKEHQKAQSVVEAFIAQDVKNKLSGKINSAKFATSKGNKVRKLFPAYKYLIAAMFIGVITFSMVNRIIYYNNDHIFLRTYSLNFEFTRSEVNNVSYLDLAQSSLSSKQSEQYAEHIRKLENIHEGDSLFNKARYLLGHLYLNNAELNKSIATFRNVIEQKSDYRKDAEWYLTLAYLKAGDEKSTRSQLNIVLKDKKSEHYYKAVKLSKELNTIWRQ